MEKIQEPPILRWERVIHKSVRTTDGSPVGYIAADDDESIIVLSGRFKEYRIPKSSVEGFDGSQVFLGLSSSDLGRFTVS
jgi:hypothetical protein